MVRKRILSGMRPTGKLHLGHLVGALENWVKLQADHDCFYMIADWHALMSEYKNPARIRADGLDNVVDWLACGVDPERSVIFRQSDVVEHVELAFILGTITPIGWLERCPTYKEQLKELADKDIKTYAFLGYPVLQAADILIYQANAVPVGEDQLPHLELTREIVRRFNHLFEKKQQSIFPEPQALLTKTARLMGLDRRKMSKSYGNVINLSDSPEDITKKIKTMITDPKRIKRNDPGHPEECNVYKYQQVFNDGRTGVLSVECKKAGIGCADCKKELSEAMFKILSPIHAKRAEILSKKGYVEEVIEGGNKKARQVARHTMAQVKKAVCV
ncbi:MAG: tryptophan--tRNA ligase [Planctomycetes bacterium]|nr:tryptophan--tRNA ligase [Planctomycetota bacterium]